LLVWRGKAGLVVMVVERGHLEWGNRGLELLLVIVGRLLVGDVLGYPRQSDLLKER
jgi:hypothetical protein